MTKTNNCIAYGAPSFAAAAEKADAELPLAFPPAPTTDAGVVRLGGQAPAFVQSQIADEGIMALGGQAPMLPVEIADAGRVRLGGQSPNC